MELESNEVLIPLRIRSVRTEDLDELNKFRDNES